MILVKELTVVIRQAQRSSQYTSGNPVPSIEKQTKRVGVNAYMYQTKNQVTSDMTAHEVIYFVFGSVLNLEVLYAPKKGQVRSSRGRGFCFFTSAILSICDAS